MVILRDLKLNNSRWTHLMAVSFHLFSTHKYYKKTSFSGRYRSVMKVFVRGPFFNERYVKEVPFCENGMQKGKRLDHGAEPHRIELCRVPSSP